MIHVKAVLTGLGLMGAVILYALISVYLPWVAISLVVAAYIGLGYLVVEFKK